MIVLENFGSRTNTIFCGVFDGHGPYGHMVAKRVRDSLPLKVSAHWEVNLKSDDVLRDVSLNTTRSMNSESTSFLTSDEESRASVNVEETEKHMDLFQALKDSFLKAYKVIDRELKMHTNIDCFCSGTTAVTLVKQEDCFYDLPYNTGCQIFVLHLRKTRDEIMKCTLSIYVDIYFD